MNRRGGSTFTSRQPGKANRRSVAFRRNSIGISGSGNSEHRPVDPLHICGRIYPVNRVSSRQIDVEMVSLRARPHHGQRVDRGHWHLDFP